MATLAAQRRRAYWRWLKSGFSQVLPYPDDVFDVKDKYMINNAIWVIGSCVVTEFQTMLDTDVDDVFLQEFAIDAYYETYDSHLYNIKGIFNDPYVESIPDTEIGVQSIGPILRVDTNDMPPAGYHQGDKIKICNVTYRIIRAEPNGVGITDLILHKVIP